MARRINADKPHLWKTDIAASVDQFNQWFMRVAPEAFHSTRVRNSGNSNSWAIGSTPEATARIGCRS